MDDHLLRIRTTSSSGWRRARRFATSMLGVLSFFILTGAAPAPSRADPAPTPTVVSLTFDDSAASQMDAARIMAMNGLRGTFYVNSGSIDSPGYMRRSDLEELSRLGHEIGGHTTNHLNLSRVTVDEARRQICIDRATLAGWGFLPRSFSYPFGAGAPQIASVIQECGYNSARALGSLRAPKGCYECPAAEALPPLNVFEIRSPGLVDPPWSFDDLTGVVTGAQSSGGGWVPLVFHQVCDGCTELSVRPEVLERFAKWLRARNVQTSTVGDVIGGPTADVVPPPRPAGTLHAVNASLEYSETGEMPDCWSRSGFGVNAVRWTRTSDSHSGAWAERIDVMSHSSGDAKLLTRMDLGDCAVHVAPGQSYRLSAWYKATERVQFAIYSRSDTGHWSYWMSSAFFDPADEWRKAEWTTPPAPSGMSAMSFGMAIAAAGSLTTDDYDAGSASAAGGISGAGIAVSAVLLSLLFFGSITAAWRSRFHASPQSEHSLMTGQRRQRVAKPHAHQAWTLSASRQPRWTAVLTATLAASVGVAVTLALLVALL